MEGSAKMIGGGGRVQKSQGGQKSMEGWGKMIGGRVQKSHNGKLPGDALGKY